MGIDRDPVSHERRRSVRRKIITGVDYTILSTPQGTGIVKNISEGGLGLLIDKYLPLGTILKLKYYSQKGGEEVLIETVGKVCWCRQSEQGYLLGVQFIT